MVGANGIHPSDQRPTGAAQLQSRLFALKLFVNSAGSKTVRRKINFGLDLSSIQGSQIIRSLSLIRDQPSGACANG
jgi:hypothetical protein